MNIEAIRARYSGKYDPNNPHHCDVGEITVFNINTLLAELERITAERDAAVEDLTTLANAVRRDGEIDEICCFACRHNEAYETDKYCPGCERDECFEWRRMKGAE